MRVDKYFEFNNKLPELQEVGVEIEMEGAELPHKVDGWTTHHDGSLRGNSMEYVLASPARRNKVNDHLNNLWQMFDHGEINPSDRCGVHIHINVRPLELNEVYKIIILYLILEDVLMQWCGDDREGNLFCLRSRDAEYLLHCLIQDRMAGRFQITINMNGFKYGSINIATLQKFGSLEFRGLGTPKNVKRVKDWIGMLLKIKDFAVNIDKTEDLVAACSFLGGQQFLINVMGAYAEQLTSPQIDHMIMEGVRRVQVLAYTPFEVDATWKPKPFPIFAPPQRVVREDLVNVNQVLDVHPGGVFFAADLAPIQVNEHRPWNHNGDLVFKGNIGGGELPQIPDDEPFPEPDWVVEDEPPVEEDDED